MVFHCCAEIRACLSPTFEDLPASVGECNTRLVDFYAEMLGLERARTGMRSMKALSIGEPSRVGDSGCVDGVPETGRDKSAIAAHVESITESGLKYRHLLLVLRAP